ncbi:unnamed protein product [Linum trigynum]|uniref:Uncharacterized protein n=1 Tax=Linum trigynum TaxID=586398 RepID=A0AAV2D9W2_9ROSI
MTYGSVYGDERMIKAQRDTSLFHDFVDRWAESLKETLRTKLACVHEEVVGLKGEMSLLKRHAKSLLHPWHNLAMYGVFMANIRVWCIRGICFAI